MAKTQIPKGAMSQQAGFFSSSLSVALVYHVARRYDSAKLYFKEAIGIFEKELENKPEVESIMLSLGLAYAGAGEKEKAIEIGERAVKIMNLDIDALQGMRTEKELMRIYILTGEYEKAIKALYKLLKYHGQYTIVHVTLDPIYDPLRGFLEFQEILDDPELQVSFD